jgi:hypothetical protein
MTTINPNYPLAAGDSVVVTITDTDDVTLAAVTPDAGSVVAVLSNPNDSVVVDPSGTFATITAGDTVGAGNTITVSATVNGFASTDVVGFYDVVADVVNDATSLSLSFGTETAPSSSSPTASAVIPGSADDPEFVLNEATGLLDHR